MNKIIIACAVSLAIGVAAGLALRPASPPGTNEVAAAADSGAMRAGSFHPLM
jgi:hypothetical protein